ncbi:MAG: 2OG-Fe(II) oxygenase [Pseudomonadota bacterium]
MYSQPLFHNFTGVIPDAVCDIIVAEGESLQQRKGTVYSDDQFKVDKSMRVTDVGFWDEWHWVNGLMTHYMAMANRSFWQYELVVSQGVQYGSYGVGHFYDWHHDTFSEPMVDSSSGNQTRLNRFLSASLLLSDENTYSGGELCFMDQEGRTYTVEGGRTKGSIVVFPSSLRHKVTPVDNGTRHSCVSWILGVVD